MEFLEDYPSLAEGNGLENRQVGKTARGFESHIFLYLNLYEWSDFITISRETAPTVRMKKLE